MDRVARPRSRRPRVYVRGVDRHPQLYRLPRRSEHKRVHHRSKRGKVSAMSSQDDGDHLRDDYAGPPRASADGFAWRESACPGCGRLVRLRGTPSVVLEWEPVADGRYIGYLVTPVLSDFTFDYEYETDSGLATGGGGTHDVPGREPLPPAHRAMIEALPPEALQSRAVWHECPYGGGGSDRAVLSPEPPPRSTAARLNRPGDAG